MFGTVSAIADELVDTFLTGECCSITQGLVIVPN